MEEGWIPTPFTPSPSTPEASSGEPREPVLGGGSARAEPALRRGWRQPLCYTQSQVIMLLTSVMSPGAQKRKLRPAVPQHLSKGALPTIGAVPL